MARGAWVRAHDPVALPKARCELKRLGVAACETAAALAEDADALVLITDWPEYRDWPWGEVAAFMRTPVIVDGRNVLDEKQLRACGLQYSGMGR